MISAKEARENIDKLKAEKQRQDERDRVRHAAAAQQWLSEFAVGASSKIVTASLEGKIAVDIRIPTYYLDDVLELFRTNGYRVSQGPSLNNASESIVTVSW